MERSNSVFMVKPWTAAMTAGLLASITWLPQAARGELVYEDNPAASAAAPADAGRVEERGVLRQALGTAERARDTRQAAQYAAPVQPQAVAVQAPAPVTVVSQPQVIAAPQAAVVAEAAPEQYAAPARQGDSVEDIRHMNKSELMRRERVRAELRNEDALQERLEELRLRDEKRRTDQILGVSGATGATGAEGSGVNMPAPLYGGVQEQAVSAPVTDRPGEAPRSPQMVAPAQAVAAPSGGVQLAGISSVNAADQSAYPSAMTASVDLDKPKDKSTFYVSPRAGLGGMSSPDGYEVNPRFAGGVAVGVATSEYLSFELGYTYAEYGVGIGSNNPYVQQYLMYQAQYGNSQNLNTLAMKQNVIDAGIKLHLLESASRVRPFLGGGAGWSKSFINYDQKILSAMKQNPYLANSPAVSDYEVTSYLGYISTGVDVKMTQNVSLDIMARYYAVLSSNESSNMNNYMFFNPGYAGQSQEKQVVGGSMSTKSFFTIMGGVTFAF
ncbi:MAG: hypothetical protein ACJ763_04910 [Bdellovibrionia bacterium]